MALVASVGLEEVEPELGLEQVRPVAQGLGRELRGKLLEKMLLETTSKLSSLRTLLWLLMKSSWWSMMWL